MKEVINRFASFFGLVAASFIGAWDLLVTIFFLVMVVSFFAELLEALKMRRASWAGFWEWTGRQAGMLMIIVIGHLIDVLLINQGIQAPASNAIRDVFLTIHILQAIGKTIVSISSLVDIDPAILATIEKFSKWINPVSAIQHLFEDTAIPENTTTTQKEEQEGE